MDETEYLLSSEKNKEHLIGSVGQTEVNSKELVIGNDSVLTLMEDMSIGELRMLKAAFDLLIGFKEQ